MEFVTLLSQAAGWGFKIYFWMHLLAFLFTWVAADRSNRFVAFVEGWTIPLWRRVELRLPRDLAPLAPYLALMLIFFCEIFVPGLVRSLGAGLLGLITFDQGILTLAWYFALGLLQVAGNLAWFLCLLAAVWFILTLVNPPMNHPLVRSVFFAVDPFITPLQRFLPRMKVDLSPLLVAVGAYFFSNFLYGLGPWVSSRLLV